MFSDVIRDPKLFRWSVRTVCAARQRYGWSAHRPFCANFPSFFDCDRQREYQARCLRDNSFQCPAKTLPTVPNSSIFEHEFPLISSTTQYLPTCRLPLPLQGALSSTKDNSQVAKTSMVIAQVSRETNNSTQKSLHSAILVPWLECGRVSLAGSQDVGHPLGITHTHTHTSLGNQEEVATRDVNNNSHWHDVPNDIRLVPFADNQFCCKTPTGSDHQIPGIVSLWRRRHEMPTGFRQVLHAVRFHLNRQMLQNSRNTCLIDVAFRTDAF